MEPGCSFCLCEARKRQGIGIRVVVVVGKRPLNFKQHLKQAVVAGLWQDLCRGAVQRTRLRHLLSVKNGSADKRKGAMFCWQWIGVFQDTDPLPELGCPHPPCRRHISPCPAFPPHACPMLFLPAPNHCGSGSLLGNQGLGSSATGLVGIPFL